MKQIILFALFLFSMNSMALIAGPFTVEGRIKYFDGKTVTVETPENVVTIPKEFVPSENIKPNAEVEIALSDEQFKKVKIEKKK